MLRERIRDVLDNPRLKATGQVEEIRELIDDEDPDSDELQEEAEDPDEDE